MRQVEPGKEVEVDLEGSRHAPCLSSRIEFYLCPGREDSNGQSKWTTIAQTDRYSVTSTIQVLIVQSALRLVLRLELLILVDKAKATGSKTKQHSATNLSFSSVHGKAYILIQYAFESKLVEGFGICRFSLETKVRSTETSK